MHGITIVNTILALNCKHHFQKVAFEELNDEAIKLDERVKFREKMEFLIIFEQKRISSMILDQFCEVL